MSMLTKKLLLVALAFPFVSYVYAVSPFEMDSVTPKSRSFPITEKGYDHFENSNFAIFFSTLEGVYNFSNNAEVFSSKNFRGFALSSNLSTIAVLNGNRLQTFFLSNGAERFWTVKEPFNPQLATYSFDTRFLNVMDDTGMIHVCLATSGQEVRSFQLQKLASQMVLSNNDYYLAAFSGNQVEVMNYETGKQRTMISATDRVHAVRFSSDSKEMAVAVADGTVILYNTQDFEPVGKILNQGKALDVCFHEDGKYLAVVNDDKNVQIINLKDRDEAIGVSFMGGVSQVRLMKSLNGDNYIFTKQGTELEQNAEFIFSPLNNIRPNYSQTLLDELNARLEEWARQGDTETTEQWNARVNEESRKKQAKLFANEISTRLAGDMVGMAAVSLDGYNSEKSILTIGFDNMTQIYLEVPSLEAASFSNADDLEFHNVQYGITSDDKFEIIYAEVVNRSTGKTYTFDNLDRQSLDFLKTDSGFVPIELVKQASMESVSLEGLKQAIVEKAKLENILTDHTKISVDTQVEASYDADGKDITNYHIDFGYEVESEFSATDDFAPGKYLIDESAAALTMLGIVEEAFADKFSQYVKAGKKVIITLTGSADALAINGKIPYNGCYGNWTNEPYYQGKELKSMMLTKSTGITSNEQLAFARALGVRSYIANRLESFHSMKTDYRYQIELAEGTGGQFRRIHVRFTFVDAF